MTSLSLARVLPVLEAFPSQRHEASRTDEARLELLRQDLTREEAARSDPPRPELHVVSSHSNVAAEAAQTSSADDDQLHWREGYEAGVAVGRAQAEAEMRDHDALLRDAVAAARAQWTRDESERIAVGVDKALAFLESEISGAAASILEQIASAAVQARAIADFSAHVRSLMRDGAAGVITIHAPADLIARLSESLSAALGTLGSVEFVPHDSAEVWVRSGATVIETRLDAWRQIHFCEA